MTPDQVRDAADRAEGKKPSKRGGGRPPSYKPTFADQARKLAQLGATDIEVADFFEVDVRTVYRWKHDHDEFCQALNAGKDKADERVVNSLYQRAVGYEQDAVKIFMPAGAPAPVYAPFREKIAPDVTAAIFWLKNRQSQDWRDKREHEHSGPGGAELVTHVVLVDAKSSKGD